MGHMPLWNGRRKATSCHRCIYVFDIVELRVSQGIVFGSLNPKEILIVGNMPVIPAGSSTGSEDEEYLQAFPVMVEGVFKSKPADLNAAKRFSFTHQEM